MTNIIGRAERIDLPELELFNLPAKVDTGAYSSSIDCVDINLSRDGDKEVLEFVLLNPQREGYTGEKVRIADFLHTQVTNAHGVQDRYVIFTDMVIHEKRVKCRFTLSDRSKLRYPILIGRRFIRDEHYLVDVRQGSGLPGDEEERDL